MSRIVRKQDFCLGENKGADQLLGNREADQRLCFRYTDSTLSLLIKSEISSFYAASGTVHVGLCQTWLETPKTGFLVSRLIYLWGLDGVGYQKGCTTTSDGKGPNILDLEKKRLILGYIMYEVKTKLLISFVVTM